MNSKTKYGYTSASFVLAWFILISSSYAFEYEQTVDLSIGLAGVELSDLPNSPNGVTGQVDLYLNARAYLTDTLDLNVRYGLAARSALSQGSSSVYGADYRIDDAPADIDVSFHQALDLLNVNINSDFGYYTLGRQAISFGQAKLYSPIDVILPANLYAATGAYRPGVDAARGTWQLGAVSELDAGLVMGADTAIFGRLKMYLLNSDVEVVGIQINEQNQMVSVGLNTGFGAVGLWQETAWLRDEVSTDFRVTVGADTTVFDNWYVFNETHYNGLGETENYSLNMAKSFYQLGAILPQAKWYNSTQINYPINILTQWNIGATINLNDHSALLNSAFNFSASDDLTVNASMIVPFSNERTADYEYGIAPILLTLKLDWFF